MRARPDKTLRIWSAACSRGQEVYSLAMFLDYLITKNNASDIRVEYYGTDIDPESVKVAQNGVYRRDELKEAPLLYLKNHWVRGTGDISEFVKAKASLKANCKFGVLNLIRPAEIAAVSGTFDLIFCRNVFIYFTPEQIKDISTALLKKLTPSGRFIIGISESLNGLGLDVKTTGVAIYARKAHSDALNVTALAAHRKEPTKVPTKVGTTPIATPTPLTGKAAPVIHFPTAAARPPTAASNFSKTATTTPPAAARKLRVLCVDDSPSIHTLLKAVFTVDSGFEIVGTALNGKEAAKKVQELSPDVMTLDIHMPEMTGIEYLEQHYKKGHCPVVMITSVSRENSSLALRALELGAADYVEKPALNQLRERTDEIRMKLKTAFRNGTVQPAALKLDRSFAATGDIHDAAFKARFIYGTLSDRARIAACLRELSPKDPATFILVEKSAQNLTEMARVFERESGRSVEAAESMPKLPALGRVFVGDFATLLPTLRSSFPGKKAAYLVFGVPTLTACTEISAALQAQLLIEEPGDGTTHPLRGRATDEFPSTSFVALSKEWFSK